MAKNLPQQIEPIVLCNMGANLTGEIAIARLLRLGELLGERTGKIAVSLQFGKDNHGFRSICGKITGLLVLTCQRCLQPMPYPLEVTVKLSPIFNEAEAANLPKDFEALFVTEEPLSLLDIIEDEILLNMPLIAKHKEGQCSVKLSDLHARTTKRGSVKH